MVRRAFWQFAATVVLVVLLVGGVGVWLVHRAATHEALSDARRETLATGRGLVTPLLGDRSLKPRLDALFASGALGAHVSHVKLWAPDGRVLYSSERQLIGQRFNLGDDELDALDRGTTEAEVSDLNRPENRFERGEGKLLEVYAGLRTADGRRVLFETYRPYTLIRADERRLLDAFTPTLIGAVVLLGLLLLPLVLRLARRLERGQAEREALLRRALDASDRERTRVARELHDGPVQRLSGVAFALAGAERAPADAAGLRDTVRVGAEQVRETVRELRGTLTELYPPNLQRQGLRAALGDVLAPLRAAGVRCELSVPADLTLRPEPEGALFRAAQEAARNVLEHADAKTVLVTVTCVADRAILEVIDDGRGFATRDRSGHFGLQLLDDLASDHGGSLEVVSTPGTGTRLHFEVAA